jgi:hypothetical protein
MNRRQRLVDPRHLIAGSTGPSCLRNCHPELTPSGRYIHRSTLWSGPFPRNRNLPRYLRETQAEKPYRMKSTIHHSYNLFHTAGFPYAGPSVRARSVGYHDHKMGAWGTDTHDCRLACCVFLLKWRRCPVHLP